MNNYSHYTSKEKYSDISDTLKKGKNVIDVGDGIMFNEFIMWLGFAVSMLFLLWVLKWFLIDILPELISDINYYVKKHSRLVTILLAITIAISIFLFTHSKVADIVAILIMLALSIPIFIFLVALLLELVKSPYADMVGSLFFRLKAPMAIGTLFFLIGCFVFVILDLVI